MSTAVLLSGGLDSAVLVADEASRDEVQPIYVSAGLAWEAAERAIVAHVLATPPFARRVRPLEAAGGEGAGDERRGAVAHHAADLIFRQRRAGALDEQRVGRVREIASRIDQRAVEVENKKLKHEI